ncbi:unnamed protein product [Neisseria lactamica Y92-1009]|nr:unnamed protein product [Neisseria lactamica Y92-1009]
MKIERPDSCFLREWRRWGGWWIGGLKPTLQLVLKSVLQPDPAIYFIARFYSQPYNPILQSV